MKPRPRSEEGAEPTTAGEVFTRRWVVDLILDLAGYGADVDLATTVAIEPACGPGAFLVPMVERLAQSCRLHGRHITEARDAIRAYDLLDRNVALARKAVAATLVSADVIQDDADRLASYWIRRADFLDPGIDVPEAQWVVGNPPYVRLEVIDHEVLARYRHSWTSMQGRADIYVGFIERGLTSLAPGGSLAYIVADRWMHNRYGARLRGLVAVDYAIDTVVQMHDVQAFDTAVHAYPAVVVVRRDRRSQTVLANANQDFDRASARQFVSWTRTQQPSTRAAVYEAARVDGWGADGRMWPMGTPDTLAMIADLEQRFGPLEQVQTGTSVGIGVATGADSVYVTHRTDLVEDDRLLPLAMSKHTRTGELDWTADPAFLVNPWDEDGLLTLDDYPRLHRYYSRHRALLLRRHVARKRPDHWHRTIDRVDSSLVAKPKLLFPDLKAAIHPVLDPGGSGGLYPHHNLYWITSTGWDMEALGGLLLSETANMFVGAYCVKMAGGCYRFQAQYLRRIRVPDPASVGKHDREALADGFRHRDVERCSGIARRLYGVSS